MNILSVREVAVRLKWPIRETRERLKALHEKHGGVLLRAVVPDRRDGRAAATKLWVDADALRRAMPQRFEAPDQDDLMHIHARFDEVEAKADRALRELAEFRRKANAWFKRAT